LQRFKKRGFSGMGYKVLAKIIEAPGEFSKLFNNEFKKKHLGIQMLATLDDLISRNTILKGIWAIILKPFRIVSELFVPNDYRGLMFVVDQKEK